MEILYMACQICGDQKTVKRCLKCYRTIMAARNRRDAPKRMRERNPMLNLVTVQKMRDSLKRIGHCPKIRMGNGKAISEPQRLLAEALGWEIEFIYPTKAGHRNGVFPNHYKIDIANQNLMIAVEVDGNSHGLISRQQQDARKADLLSLHGWTVLRFSNKMVMENLSACVQMVRSTILRLKNITPISQMDL